MGRQATAGILEANAEPATGADLWARGVADHETELGPVGVARAAHAARRLAALDTMVDGVFEHRLQQQGWDFDVFDRIVELDLDVQPVAKAQLLEA